MNWKQRFERARKNGGFTDADRKASRSWRHCAVGEVLHDKGHRNPRHGFSQTGRQVGHKDSELMKLGRVFTSAIHCNRIDNAKESYTVIENHEITPALMSWIKGNANMLKMSTR